MAFQSCLPCLGVASFCFLFALGDVFLLFSFVALGAVLFFFLLLFVSFFLGFLVLCHFEYCCVGARAHAFPFS